MYNTIIKEVDGTIKSYVTSKNTEGCGISVSINGEDARFSNRSELDFHKKLRINAIKFNKKILGGDILPYTGKYDINPFKK